MTRDYDEWHRAYDDPASTLAWRLGAVRAHIGDFLDRTCGPVRVLSSCAGDGRDVLGVLAGRADAARAAVTLVELHPALVERARETARTEVPHVRVDVRMADAGSIDAYVGAIPADLVLLVGILGNISEDDVARTIAAAPALCAPAATLLWTRGRAGAEFDDLDAQVRAWFAAAGFTETAHQTLERGSRPTVGAVRYDGPARPLAPGTPLFTFVR